MMRRPVLLLILLIEMLTLAAPGNAAETDLAGRYACQGVNADGSSYEAVVEIAKHNDEYLLAWIAGSQVVAVGMGIRTGDVLAVAYLSTLPGVVVYRIEQGDQLIGQWTVAGLEGRILPEILTKLASEPRVEPRRETPASPPSPATVREL